MKMFQFSSWLCVIDKKRTFHGDSKIRCTDKTRVLLRTFQAGNKVLELMPSVIELFHWHCGLKSYDIDVFDSFPCTKGWEGSQICQKSENGDFLIIGFLMHIGQVGHLGSPSLHLIPYRKHWGPLKTLSSSMLTDFDDFAIFWSDFLMFCFQKRVFVGEL